METRAHHVLIGLFALVVVGAALLFGLWLGKSGHDRAFNDYDIIFEEAVQGLSQGSMVQFNGIRVGEVSRLRLDPDDPRRVIARVRLDAQTPVRSNTRARLMMAGITGISTIQLSSGDYSDDAPAKPLETPAGNDVPVIVAQPSPMSRLLTGGEDIMLNANQLVMQARELLAPANVAALSRTLENVESLTRNLNAQSGELREALRAMGEAGRQANASLAEATKVLASANRLLEQDGEATLAGARKAMLAMERALDSVNALVVDNRARLDAGLQGVSEIGPAIHEVRAAVAALRVLTTRLEEDPSGFILGREQATEFKP